MKLPQSELTTKQQLHEFDNWITPSLQQIQDTDKYVDELSKAETILNALGLVSNNFDSLSHFHQDEISRICIELIEEKIEKITTIQEQEKVAVELIESLISLLFMVSGKTDNNIKCQFPVHLTQGLNVTHFPGKKSAKSVVSFVDGSLGRVLKSDKVAKLIGEATVWSTKKKDFYYLEERAKWLLKHYIETILNDEESIIQFWALGNSYFHLREKSPGVERSLLAPIVIYKVRGSVSASGGHIPENMLRKQMDYWGMERGVDYNLDDVKVDQVEGSKDKTRAYDFALPFRSEGWEHKLFIQCQFYAGDSGSVSHKVVDQTSASRSVTLAKFPDARFIEYLDGAGYFASLNTDLKHMLSMENTRSFFQVRSASVRLRRELQDVGFLTLLEVEHAIFRSQNGAISEVKELLLSEGYTDPEISRVLFKSISNGHLKETDGRYVVSSQRSEAARKFMLIDVIANIGCCHESTKLSGLALIPGYGAYFGITIQAVSNKLDEIAPNISYDRNSFASDITWLSQEGYIVLR